MRSNNWDAMHHYVKLQTKIGELRSSERGASLVEYALLITLLALIAVVAVRFFGQELSTAYDDIANSMP